MSYVCHLLRDTVQGKEKYLDVGNCHLLTRSNTVQSPEVNLIAKKNLNCTGTAAVIDKSSQRVQSEACRKLKGSRLGLLLCYVEAFFTVKYLC